MGQPTERGPDVIGRRAFLRSGASAGAATLLAGTRGAAPVQATDPAAAPDISGFELDEATIAGLQDRMQNGRSSAVEIAEAYLNRIAALDKKGPSLRSVLETNPDALNDAKTLDAERKAGKVTRTAARHSRSCSRTTSTRPTA